MIKPKLTPAQQQAVDSEASPLVVRAGAGSGKTVVLVERYLRLVLGPRGLSPRQILAATFTEKAAAEMKERVAKALVEKDRPDLVAELNAAPICTLHGFCSRVITPHTLELGLDPTYSILDEHQATLLQEETLTIILARWRKDIPERLEAIVSGLHWSGDFNLRSGRPPSSRGFSRQFLELIEAVRCAGKAGESPFVPLPGSYQEVRQLAQNLLTDLRRILRTMKESSAPASQDKARLACSCMERYLLLTDPGHPEILQISGQIRGISLNVCAELKPALAAVKQKFCPALLDEYYRPRYEAVREALEVLYTEFLAAYEAEKTQQGNLDFLDLEEKALQILHDPRKSPPILEILIDEAQDLNPVQWEIIDTLKGNSASRSLFIVGDAQQSIYGFRYTEVGEFLKRAAQAKLKGGEEILLEDNFRSRKSVLGAVNSLFESLWDRGGAVSFLRLQGKFPYPARPDDFPELLLAEGSDREAAREAEADLLVRRLKMLIRGGEFQVHEEKTSAGEQQIQPRAPRWGDALVLVRSGSVFGPLERAFRKQDVPFLIQAGRTFWDALEIADLMALLRSLEDPGDSFSLACLLRSPAVGFSDDDLLELRLEKIETEAEGPSWKQRPVYIGLRTTSDASQPAGSLARRAAAFLDLFVRLLALKHSLARSRLLEIWISETGMEVEWMAQQEGRLKVNNVRKFLRLCDDQVGQSLSALRAVFEEIRLREVREAEAPYPESGEGAVRVMTVHGAKGLEAPIVAIFDMNHQVKGGAGAFAYSRDQDAAFSVEDPQAEDPVHEPVIFTEIGEAKSVRGKEEDLRVLYVAMTRAREKLILSASATLGKKGKRKISGWFDTFLKRYNLDQEQIFDRTILPSGYIQLADAQGISNQYILIRHDDPMIVPDNHKETVTVATPKPAGFPAPPQPGLEPVSVVAYLKESGNFPVDFQVADDGSLLSDDEPQGGIELGRWVHRLLEVLPWNLPEAAWEEYARREARLLFQREAEPHEIAEALRLTANFLKSPLAAQARTARRIQKEFPLLFEAQGVLLKGKLDLAFEDESGWTLVDYKSDQRISEERLGTYKAQASLYAQGWEGLTGAPPHRVLLFFLNTAQEVEARG